MFKMHFEHVVKTAEWCGSDRRQMKWTLHRDFCLPFPPYTGLAIKSDKDYFVITDLKTGHHDLTPLHWDDKEQTFNFSVVDVLSLAEARSLVERLKREGYFVHREPKESPKHAEVVKDAGCVKKTKCDAGLH